MPELSGHQKPSAWTLSKAHDSNQLVRVHCGYRNIRRWYLPGDIQQLLGDIPADSIRLRCDRCKNIDGIIATFDRPSASERQQITVRRLAEVKTVKKVIWRDEK